jgi:hypothetical protein
MKKILHFILIAVSWLYFSCSGYGSKELVGGYYYSKKDARIESHNGYSQNEIYPWILDYDFNEDYIIAKQKPDRSNYKTYIGFNLYMRYKAYAAYLRNPNIINIEDGINLRKANIDKDSLNYKLFLSYNASESNTARDIEIYTKIGDSLCNNIPKLKRIFLNDINYWILDIRHDSLIGPLGGQEYFEERTRLNVPSKLRLSD